MHGIDSKVRYCMVGSEPAIKRRKSQAIYLGYESQLRPYTGNDIFTKKNEKQLFYSHNAVTKKNA